MPNADNNSPSPTKNAVTEEYDIVTIGSGAGGKVIASTFASKGQRVAPSGSTSMQTELRNR
jgi:hypothetical protein